MGSCGGAAGTQGVQQTPTMTQVGEATISFSGTAKPSVLAGENGITVAAMAGASISSFVVDPGSKLSDTSIAWCDGGPAMEYQHGLTTLPLDTPGHYASGLAYGHDGHLYYADFAADAIDKSYFDGSSLANVLTDANYPTDLAVAPNGQTVVFGDVNGGIFACPQTGNTLTTLDGAGYYPAISPNGNTVAYVKYVGSNPAYYQIFTVPISGGTATQLTNDGINHYFPTYSPDGNYIVCDNDSGSVRSLVSYTAASGQPGYTLSPVPYASHACFSPDGHYLVYQYSSSYSDTNPSICIQDYYGKTQQTIGSGTKPTWSPFLSSRTFVGSGGAMFTSPVAGFIFPQIQTGLASLLTFKATTPSAATVTAIQPGTSEEGPFVYDVHADDLTSIKYTNSYYVAAITVTPGVSDALVTVDSSLGAIQSVAPFVLTRGSQVMPVSTAAGLQVIAHFTGVWDSHGKNLAPYGASAIVVDSKHGKVLSVTR